MPAPTPQRPLQAGRQGSMGRGAGDAAAVLRLRETIEVLHAERVRLLRQRRIHLIMLGLAFSLPVHIAIMLWLASISLPGPAGAAGPEVIFELGVLSDEELADGPRDPAMLPLEESAAIAGDLPAALEATTPAIAAESASSGALEAAGSGPAGGGPASGGGLGIGGGAGGTSFFGVGGRGSRFAYIVDVSGSMSQGDRLPVAFDELKRSIGALPDFASFLVVLFSDGTREPPMQRSGYVRAMPGNIVRLNRWLDEQGPMGGTDPTHAFERVFTLDPPPDMIFFLTDGEIPGNIPGWIAQRNGRDGRRKVIIHTIAFSTDASQDSLRRIARESEGTFRFVPARGHR